MFLDKFISETGSIFWFSLLALSILSFLVIKLKTLMGPIAVALLYFIISISWALNFVNAVDAILLLFLFVLIVFSIRFGSSINNNIKIKNASFNMPSAKLIWIIFGGFLFSSFFFLFSVFYSGDHSKLSWTVEYRYFSYLLSFMMSVVLSVAFFLMTRRVYLYYFLTVLAFLFYGLTVGSKGVLINLAVLFIVLYVSRLNKLNFSNLVFSRAVFIPLATVILSAFLFFGSDPYIPFMSRLAATADGLFIIKTSQLYPDFELDFSVWRYIFDAFASKIYGSIESIGQILASESLFLPYPPYGGPNDSVVIYMLLSGSVDKFFIFIMMSALSMLFGFVDSIFKKNINNITLLTCLFLLPLYLQFSGLYQGVGTFFILLARTYIVLVPFVFFLYVIGASASEKK